MHHDDGKDAKRFRHVIAVGNRVHAVPGQGGKPQHFRGEGPIKGIIRAGECARPQGHHVDPLRGVLHARVVSFQHFHVCQKVMSQQHRLGPLKVGISGQDDVDGLTSLLQERPLKPLEAKGDPLKVVAEIQPEVQRHLIVSTASGVQFSADGTDEFRDSTFHGHVNVLVRIREGEPTFPQLRSDAPEPAHEQTAFRPGENLGFFQSLTMGETAQNVIFEQVSVEGKR